MYACGGSRKITPTKKKNNNKKKNKKSDIQTEQDLIRLRKWWDSGANILNISPKQAKPATARFILRFACASIANLALIAAFGCG